MNFEVIMPFGGDCPHRLAARKWVHDRLGGVMIRDAPAPEGPWCKGLAVRAALTECAADIVAIADADVYTTGLHDAVGAVDGGAPWAIPHLHVHRLTAKGTAAVLAGRDWREQSLEQEPYKGIPAGGIVVAPREVVQSIPPDVRFMGWGQEDECWAMALTAILGPPWRGEADLVHLWHPPQERMTRRRGSTANWKLRSRYFAARNDPAAMRALLEEPRVASPDAQPPLHDHA